MTFKRYPNNDYHTTQNSYLEARKSGVVTSVPSLLPLSQSSEHSSMNFTAPTDLPPRKGKRLAFAVMVSLIAYGAYTAWNSYLRYDSFGIVNSDVIGVHSTSQGLITNIAVVEGSVVKKGDFLAQVSSNDNIRQISKLTDELRIAFAELESKRDELAKNKIARIDQIRQIEGQIADTSAAIGELKAKLSFQRGEASRYIKLKAMDAAGAQEVALAKSQTNSIASILNGKEVSLKTLKIRLSSLIDDPIIDASLKPIEARIDYLNNEKARYTAKIQEGIVYSQHDGIVSSIEKKQGELVETDPILKIVVNGTASLILYYDPAAKIPAVGEKIQVLVPSLGKMVDTQVVSISKNAESPPDQIRLNYLANQKLVKVYLEPENGYDDFVVGSVIKKPNATDFIKGVLNIASFSVSNSYAK